MSSTNISPIPRLEQHARFHGDRVALIYEDRRISYAELFAEAGQLAAAMQKDGIGRGDRVAYLGMNSATLVVTYLACTWVAAAFVPVNYRFAGPEVRALLEDARPDIVIAEPAHAVLVDPFTSELGVRRHLLIDGDPSARAPEGAQPSQLWQPLADFAETGTERVPPQNAYDEDLAVLLYTSGTTGRAKGVMLTHGNVWWNSVNVDSVVDTRVDDVYLAVAPLFHIGGLNTFTLRGITRGSTTVIRRSFEPEQTLADLQEFGINGMFAVPAMLAAMERQPGFLKADLSQLRSTIVAGAPVPPALISRYAEKGVLLQQAWGLTETSPFATYLEASKTMVKLGSVGVAMPYTEVAVVNVEKLEPVNETLEAGELWVRGPNVAAGYWNNAAATTSSFTEDGWFRTGDIGYADADGYFFIVDRLKDMIVSGGENVYPAELENVLQADPRIRDVAVVGTPDERWGEAVVAVVVLEPEANLTLEEVREFAGTELARYKLPSRLVLVDSLPRNGSGKLEKPAIRATVASHLSTGT